jgi:2-polyprenyl-6-methoxyphenol hydroxylase-like FAD-dependent oxidoreductase
MEKKKLKVLVIGAGTGGLCLAHGLRAAGIEVRIFERDRAPEDRIFGYRLNISSTGNRALASCLPKANYERFVAASAISSSSVAFFDQNLKRLLCIELPRVDRASVESERPVSRIALRKVLLDGVEDLVTFDRTFQAYEEAPSNQVTAHFEDGSTDTGDLLVGADGASSRVARQLLPQSKRIDTGILVISGRFPLHAEARHGTPPSVLRGPTLILGPAGRFMFASAVEYPPEANTPYDRDEYVMWGLSARREDLGLTGSPAGLDAETARTLALENMLHWDPALRRMVERADAAHMNTFAVKSASPISSWNTRNVTVLGDALHNMTPYRGVGANAALLDAQMLRDAVVPVSRGETALIPALSNFERKMIERGFAAVRSSLADMERFHAKSPFRRFAMKSTFRVMDAIPPLQRLLRGER